MNTTNSAPYQFDYREVAGGWAWGEAGGAGGGVVGGVEDTGCGGGE